MSSIEPKNSQGTPASEQGEGAAGRDHQTLEKTAELLADARVYLPGPMDFVASREEESQTGRRTRVTEFLRQFGTTVQLSLTSVTLSCFLLYPWWIINS